MATILIFRRALNGALQELLVRRYAGLSGSQSINYAIWFAFISSREREFLEERSNIAKSLRQQRFDSFLAESIPISPNASQIVTSKISQISEVLSKAIRYSDLYLLLAGAEYGEPPSWSPNISATEWEFGVARKTRKRFLRRYPRGTAALLIVVKIINDSVDTKQKIFREELTKQYYCIFCDRADVVPTVTQLSRVARKNLILTNLLWLSTSLIAFIASTGWLIYAFLFTPHIALGVWALWAPSVALFFRSIFPNLPTVEVT